MLCRGRSHSNVSLLMKVWESIVTSSKGTRGLRNIFFAPSHSGPPLRNHMINVDFIVDLGFIAKSHDTVLSFYHTVTTDLWSKGFFFLYLLTIRRRRKSTSTLLSGCHHTSPTQTQLDEIVSRLQVRFLLPSLAQRWLTVSIYDSSERELGYLRHFGHRYWTLIVTRISNRAMWKQKTWPVSRCVGGTGRG